MIREICLVKTSNLHRQNLNKFGGESVIKRQIRDSVLPLFVFPASFRRRTNNEKKITNYRISSNDGFFADGNQSSRSIGTKQRLQSDKKQRRFFCQCHRKNNETEKRNFAPNCNVRRTGSCRRQSQNRQKMD